MPATRSSTNHILTTISIQNGGCTVEDSPVEEFAATKSHRCELAQAHHGVEVALGMSRSWRFATFGKACVCRSCLHRAIQSRGNACEIRKWTRALQISRCNHGVVEHVNEDRECDSATLSAPFVISNFPSCSRQHRYAPQQLRHT